MRHDAQHYSRLFGQMFAVRPECLDELRMRGRRLPIGLYRCDGLFSGFLCYETDGCAHERPVQRILTVPAAQWRIKPISTYRWADVVRGFDRLVRQARGRLENQAWNSILWTRGFDALPRFANDMILRWLQTHQPMPERTVNRFFTQIALRQIRKWECVPERDLAPHRVA